MEALTLQSLENEWIIKIDKNQFPPEFLVKMLKRIQLEWLAKKANFDNTLANQLADDIETGWWAKNGEAFLKNVQR